MQIRSEQFRSVKIRADLTQSHDQVWAALASPGAWLSGRERVDVAKELRAARFCEFCQARKEALSPLAVQGEHQRSEADLSATRVELIHKLVTDPGRITRSWVDQLHADGIGDGEYVEIAALVSSVLVVDTFHTALGLPLRELPTPIAGNPSGKRPRTAAMEDAFVPLIAADALTDDYTDIYDTEHFVPNVHRAFSLVPDATRLANVLMAAHYFPYEKVTQYTDADHNYAINKMQIELLAARVSKYNDCFY